MKMLAKGEKFIEQGGVARTIEIPNDWSALLKSSVKKAIDEQTRIKEEFQKAFADNLICRGFERDKENPKYLLYKN
ncbi:MAG: hypothetical protein LC778_13020 [Acidobacteria bacterium]|nr:hypothetical protein [Acidobacteriota bacterium]